MRHLDFDPFLRTSGWKRSFWKRPIKRREVYASKESKEEENIA